MKTSGKVSVAFAAFAALTIAAPLSANAGVMTLPNRATISPDSPLEQIHYRYHHHHHWRHAHYHHHWRYAHWHRHWHYARYHRHYAYYPPRYGYYGYYPRYGYYGYNPAGALAGAAVSLGTAPLWALFGGPYWW